MTCGDSVQPGRTEAAQRAAGVIARYRPGGVSEPAGAAVRELIAAAPPATPARAKALLFAAGRLVGFCERVGLQLAPEVVVHPATTGDPPDAA